MQKIYYLYLALLVVTGCEKNIFGPNRGTLSGIVTDQNDVPISGVEITSSFLVSIDDEGNGRFREAKGTTDQDGYYELRQVGLDENEVVYKKDGFEELTQIVFISQEDNNQLLNVVLTGSPILTSFAVSDDQLSLTENDTTEISVTFLDEFQEFSSTNYTVNMILNLDGVIAGIIPLELEFSSIRNFSFFKQIEASEFQDTVVYSLDVEIQDPDGNFTSNLEVGTLEITP